MAILILGMHRSGTSAITRLIGDMGAYLAPDSLLLAPSADNPQGFWERRDVLNINRAILKAQNCNWHQVAEFDSRLPLPAALQAPMQACAGELASHAPFVVKDPRFCLTLPYWRPLLAPKAIVLALRHPATIADSLARRNAMPPAQALALWELYMTQALKNTEGMQIIGCEFEKLLAEPEKETAALHAALRKHVPTLKSPETRSLIPTPPRATNIALTAAQQTLYDKLINTHKS